MGVTSIISTPGNTKAEAPLKRAFLKWQCRVRQNAMRDNQGRPDDGIMPALYLAGETEPVGYIITLLNKSSNYSVTAELKHMLAKTNDPAQRHDQALRYFSATYYQKAREFSDILTATFQATSTGAERILNTGDVMLVFDAFMQRFELACSVSRLSQANSLYESTMAHNRLFNDALKPDTIVLAFKPNWEASSSDPDYR